MKQNLVEMVFILDRSGSMSHLVDDTIGGFNSLIEKQKQETGDAFVTTVLFDDEYKLLHDHVDIKDVQPMTRNEYFARGMTALLDAVGRTINKVGERLSNTPEEERPSQVMFVITTDGYENCSSEFKLSQIREMIKHQQEKYSWKFIFLGANMDAAQEAGNLGINQQFARTYSNSSRGVGTVYAAVCDTMSVVRTSAANSIGEDVMAKAMESALDEVE